MTTTTYAVYTMTPRGGFSQKYEGTSLGEATQAYNKLEKTNKARNLTKREGGLGITLQSGGGFPKD